MKTLKFIAMLFIVSALSFGFASCGDDKDDEPTIVTPQAPVETDYSSLIPGHWANKDVDEEYYTVTLSINYKGAGTIGFYDLINDGDDQYGVMAFGSYTLVGSKLTATYNDVTCMDSHWESFTYHGFSDGKSKTVVYTIQSCDGKKLVLKDESGKTLNYEKYADIK